MDNIKKKTILLSILAFLLGSFAFLSVPFIQSPIQNLLTRSNFFYKINSLFVMALLFGLVSAIIQRSFTFIAAHFSNTYALAGFLSGIGFGLTETIYTLYYQLPFSISKDKKLLFILVIISKLFSILFHGSCTGILMIGLQEKKFGYYFIPILIIHTAIIGLSVLSLIATIIEYSFVIISIIISLVLFIYFMIISKKMKIVLKWE